jgi:FMN phosphatase YigB (HAD superfamily)
MAGRKSNLFLALDAFGTLFRPRTPVSWQYANVAQAHGLAHVSAGDIDASFRKAFKEESSKHPNHGKAAGMSPTSWWANIITNTFTPLLDANQTLPPALVPDLLERFASKRAYEWTPGARELFNDLRRHKSGKQLDSRLSQWETIVVGVISNSDGRVVDVLRSLGLRIQDRRYEAGRQSESAPAACLSMEDDINYVILSYDVGYEKPDKRIFDAARDMLAWDLQYGRHTSPSGETLSVDDFEFLLVGDEPLKDLVGASGAGWHAIHFDPQMPPAVSRTMDVEIDGTSISTPRLPNLTHLVWWTPP